MTAQEARWDGGCLEVLAVALASGSAGAVGVWRELHLDGTPECDRDYAVAVIAVSTTRLAEIGERIRATGDGDFMFAPGQHPSLPQGDRDAELVTVLQLNEDWPGVLGAIAGIQDRGGFDEFRTALEGAAFVFLTAEAMEARRG